MSSTQRTLSVLAAVGFCNVCVAAPNVDYCSGIERWATSMAYTNLKNARLIDSKKVTTRRQRQSVLHPRRLGKTSFVKFTK